MLHGEQKSLPSSQNPFHSIFVLLIVQDEIVMGRPLKLHFMQLKKKWTTFRYQKEHPIDTTYS